MQVIRLHDEVALMTDLCADTVKLIHSTIKIPAIKLLLQAYDIIDLNLKIEKEYKEYKEYPPWDFSALKELNQVRCEILVFHRLDFSPFRLVDVYSNKVEGLYKIVENRIKC